MMFRTSAPTSGYRRTLNAHVFRLFGTVFDLPDQQVIVLSGIDRLSKGDVVFAVYPDTTSFYQATVVQAPRKQGGVPGQFVMVNFVDDADEFGITHDKAVPIQHIMLPPSSV